MAVAQQLTIHIQRQVENIVVHTHRADSDAERRHGRAVSEKGIADALSLLKRTQQRLAPRQAFAVNARHKAPACVSGVHFGRQIIAEEAVHQAGAGREHARQIVRGDFAAAIARQRIASGDRLAAEAADLDVDALANVLHIAALSVAAGADRQVGKHILQRSRQPSGAGLQPADRFARRRRHAAVGGILHRRQVAIKLIDLLEKIIEDDGFAALLQRLSQLNHRRIMFSDPLLRRLRRRRRLRGLTRTEQRFQRAGGAVALIARLLLRFLRRQPLQHQIMAQIHHQLAQRRIAAGKQPRAVNALRQIGAVVELDIAQQLIPTAHKVFHIALTHRVVGLLLIFIGGRAAQHPDVILVQRRSHRIDIFIEAVPVSFRGKESGNAFA